MPRSAPSSPPSVPMSSALSSTSSSTSPPRIIVSRPDPSRQGTNDDEVLTAMSVTTGHVPWRIRILIQGYRDTGIAMIRNAIKEKVNMFICLFQCSVHKCMSCLCRAKRRGTQKQFRSLRNDTS